MSQPVSTPTKPTVQEREPAKPPRSVRMDDLRKRHAKSGAVAAGGLLALVGLAAVVLG